MATIEIYFGIENINLNASQRNQLIAALQALGTANSDPQPRRRNHWRIRTDQQAAIFQAAFDDSALTIAAMKARLATIFGVSAASIDHATAVASFGAGTTQVVTFSRLGPDYIRAAAFGGTSATLEASRLEALAYIAANAEAWAAE